VPGLAAKPVIDGGEYAADAAVSESGSKASIAIQPPEEMV
jgi:hypothetical protein